MTSRHYSPKLRDSREDILRNTARSLDDLKKQLDELQQTQTEGNEDTFDNQANRCEGTGRRPKELWSCRINAGLFGVPWLRTKGRLEESGLKVTVVRPPGEPL